jgi:HK97 family phage portal protein
MGIIDRLFKKAIPMDMGQSFIYETLNTSQFTLKKDDLIEKYTSQGYQTNPEVFAVTSKIYQMFGRLNFDMEDKGGKYAGELSSVMTRPNTYQTWTEFMESWELHGLLWGNAIVYCPKYESGNMKGQPMYFELWPLQYVNIKPSGGIPIYEYTVGATMKTVPASDIWHTKFYQNPDYKGGANYFGVSPLRVAANMIAASNEGLDFLNKVYAMPLPPAIVVRKETQYGNTGLETNETEQKEFESAWMKRQSGKKKGVPMLTRGEVSLLQTKTNTVTDLQIVEVNSMLMEKLCNIYGVPPHIFSTNAATESNVKIAHRAIYTNVIIPHAEKFIDGFNFLIKDTGNKLKCRYSDIPELQDDKIQLSQWTGAAFQNGALSPNEVRELLGLERIESPEMDSRYIGMGLQQLGLDFSQLEDKAWANMK